MTRTTFFLLGVVVLGCGPAAPPAATQPTAVKSTADEADHDHTKDKMMDAHAGPHLAYLTAHLSKSGNELDVFFEGHDDGKPVALPLAKFAAKAVKTDGSEIDLLFEPAPANERPAGEAPGTCSHFVAKAPTITATDAYAVTATIPIDGKDRRVRWRNFVPGKFAHHVD
ncbi:MAG: hypothetical protein U0871_10665 [Gemmataceae bacterium]